MAFELVVETTRDSRTGKQSRRSWVEYCGSGSDALAIQRSKSYRSQGTEKSLVRRARSTSCRRTHGDGFNEISRVHGLDPAQAVSHYHVEVRSKSQQPSISSSNRRSRLSSNEVGVDLVTVYPVEENNHSKSKSRKSKSKKSRRHKHHSISVSALDGEDSMALVPLYEVPVQYPRIEYAEPVEYQLLTYEHEDVNIVHAEPPPPVQPIYAPADFYQSQPAVYEAPLVTTTGPGEEQHSPSTPKQRYFIDPNATIPGSPIMASLSRPGGSASYSMYGAITNDSELSRPHSSGFYEPRPTSVHNDRRYSVSGSAHGHSISASAKYHSSGHHSSRPNSLYSTTSSSGTDSDNSNRHRHSVYIGTEHLRNENHGHRGVRLRYGGEREHVIDVGLGHSTKEKTPLGKGGLKSKLKAAGASAARSSGKSKRGGSTSSSRSSTTTSSSSSTSSTSTSGSDSD